MIHLLRLNKTVTLSAVIFNDIPAEEPFLAGRPDRWVSLAPEIDDAVYKERERTEEMELNDDGGIEPSSFDVRDIPRPQKMPREGEVGLNRKHIKIPAYGERRSEGANDRIIARGRNTPKKYLQKVLRKAKILWRWGRTWNKLCIQRQQRETSKTHTGT